MIISASVRTDIPAFYADWFFHRLAAGHVLVRNPFSGKPYSVDLHPHSVSAFVFWTRNFQPILRRLPTLLQFGRPFVVQFTITAYPRQLEAAVIPPDKAIEQIRRLSSEVHPLTPVWRYDPIVFSSLTPASFHIENFSRLAEALSGHTTEVAISFLQTYRKTRRNLDAAARLHHLQWDDPPDARKLDLAARRLDSARARRLTLTLCTQPQYLLPGLAEARCIDARRLSQVLGSPLDVPIKGTRPGCACHESRDIGEYNTCPHGCAYCYAVTHPRVALARYRAHSVPCESLLPIERPQPPGLPLFPPEH
ncbi:MAG: DUF1848 domain-containing protein [Acidobacteria bacterium]|nr:DUF1848 domain-containing protein [Acidobacteriota bacterium]